ncbi:uncharacterized protein AKAME5_001675100 [Lates japonicus]|uniref:Ig-like domain-containing protein n=1 Tax=Lates japonicus TaxID=270547 RepID=A0AAD3N3C0_LATJO|nr:uncharacterized protein AKAME5_001675100 [Lates japonicus]
MKVLLVVALVTLIHASYATLLIKGPTEPVLEGQMITLECQYSDSEFNISQVHFEVFSKYMQSWRLIYERSWCYYTMDIERTADSVFLYIPRAGRFSEGPYRCVNYGENVTAPDNSSQTLAFKVHYMGDLSLTREGYTSYLGVPQELKVQPGEDVVLKCAASSSDELSYFWHKEGSDWILPSSKLTLKKMSATDEGQYTCMAQHPSMESLSRKRSVSITVLSGKRNTEQRDQRGISTTAMAFATVWNYCVPLTIITVACLVRTGRSANVARQRPPVTPVTKVIIPTQALRRSAHYP